MNMSERCAHMAAHCADKSQPCKKVEQDESELCASKLA